MEHPKDPYHVRPFPRQPHRGGKELKLALKDLESTLAETVPDLERLRAIQARIHEVANTYNDDRLIDMLRQISLDLDVYETKPERALLEKILKQILKVRIELKHL